MEKHQVLKPRRTRGTPMQKFIFKSFFVATAVCLGMVYHYTVRHREDYLYKVRAGLYEESNEIKKRRLYMSMGLLYTLQPPEKLDQKFEETMTDISRYAETVPLQVPSDDF